MSLGNDVNDLVVHANLGELAYLNKNGFVLNKGTAIIDFGVIGGNGSNEANITVTGQNDILSSSSIRLTVLSDSTTANHTANDHAYFLALAALSTNTPTTGVGFTIYAKSIHKLTGQFLINWSWR